MRALIGIAVIICGRTELIWRVGAKPMTCCGLYRTHLENEGTNYDLARTLPIIKSNLPEFPFKAIHEFCTKILWNLVTLTYWKVQQLRISLVSSHFRSHSGKSGLSLNHEIPQNISRVI